MCKLCVMCKFSICLNSDASCSNIVEFLLIFNNFCNQDKTTHTLLDASKIFDQFGKRKEGSRKKTNWSSSIKSLINFINQENIMFIPFKERLIPKVADSVIRLILLRLVFYSWFNGFERHPRSLLVDHHQQDEVYTSSYQLT